MLGEPCRRRGDKIEIDTSTPKPKETFVYTFLLQFWPEKNNEGMVTLPEIGAVNGHLSPCFPVLAPLQAFPSATFDERGNLEVIPSEPLVLNVVDDPEKCWECSCKKCLKESKPPPPRQRTRSHQSASLRNASNCLC